MATYTEVTSTSQTMSANNGYVANNAGLVTFTIPTTAAFGSYLIVIGKGAGGWKIEQPNGSIIHYGNKDTTTGTSGYVTSNHRYDSIELICSVANTDWVVANSHGNIQYT